MLRCGAELPDQCRFIKPNVPTFIFIAVACALSALLLLLGGVQTRMAIPAFGLLGAAAVFNSIRAPSQNAKNCSAGCMAATVIFCGYIIARIIASPDRYIARADLFIVIAASIVYILFAFTFFSSRLRVRFVFLLLVVAAANSIVGGIQFFKGHNFMPFSFLPRGDYGARASGFYGCPNHLAGYLEIVMFFGLSLACWSRSNLLIRIGAGYGAVMCVAGIVLSGSRGGYASSVAGLIAFGFISLLLAGKWLRREFWYAVIACALAAVAGGGYILRSIVQQSDFLQHRVEAVNSDMGVRASLAKAALKQFHLNPWAGTGSRTYQYYGRQFRDSSILEDPIYAHNDYLQLLAEYGIIGFATFGVFLVVHMFGGWRLLLAVAADQNDSSRPRAPAKRSGKGSRSRSAWRAVADDESKRLEQQRPAFKGSNSLALTVAAFCSVIAYLVHSVVDFNLHIPANACVMAFVFAILANPGTNSTTGARDSRDSFAAKMTPFGRFVPAALGLWLMFVSLPKLPAEICREKARVLLSDWRMLDSVEFATQAEEAARKGLGYDHKNPELYFYLGEAQVLLADFAETADERNRMNEASIVSFKSALDLSPRDVRYVLSLASSLDAVERFDEAESTLAFAVELDPNSGKPHTAYAEHFHAQKKLEQAEVEYEIAAKLTNAQFEWTRLNAIRKEIADKKMIDDASAGAPK